MKIKDFYRELATALRQAKFETPELDARFLLAALTSIQPAQVPFAEAELDETQTRRLAEFRARRLAHKSVARIIGTRGFWTLELELSPATLEPRPDSEALIEAALAHLDCRRFERLKIVDLGTGSGALLLALLDEFKNACGVGIDISADAVQTASRNAQKNKLDARAQFICGSWLEALRGKFDLIVANPPYGRSEEMAALPNEVRLYDPPRAIDGGSDGLDAYRVIAADAAAHLAAEGLLLLEAGDGQSKAIEALFVDSGYRLLSSRNDLAGHERAMIFAQPHSKIAKLGANKKFLEKPMRGAKTMFAP